MACPLRPDELMGAGCVLQAIYDAGFDTTLLNDEAGTITETMLHIEGMATPTHAEALEAALLAVPGVELVSTPLLCA